MQEHKKGINNEQLSEDKLINRFSLLKHIPFNGSSFNPKKTSIKISLLYIIIGCLWILLSDNIVNRLISEKKAIELISIIKGGSFVIVSGIIIYILVSYTMGRIAKAEKSVIEGYEELTATYEELEASYEEIAASEEEIKQQFDELQIYSKLVSASEDRLNRAQTLAKVGNWELDLQNNEIWASEEAFRLYGIDRETPNLPLELVQAVVHKDSREKMNKALKLLLEKNEKYDMEYKVVRMNDNVERIIHSVAEINFNSLGMPEKVLGVIHDITESKINQEMIRHLAYYDSLTDLPNRILFIGKLEEAMGMAKKNNAKIAIVFFDIDNFKKINDLMGHHVGDKLLINISNKLKLSLHVNETLARFSGDEFTIFMENVCHTEEIFMFIDRIKKVFNSPFITNNHTIHISSSFGISIYPDHGETTEELLKNADTAMYKAKETGRNNSKLYDDNMRNEILNKLQLEKHLSRALENNEFYLCYQPQVHTNSYEIRGFEALIRWKSNELGLVSPFEFISIAEETGLIIPIGEWVLEEACQTNKKLHEKYKVDYIVSVNISPVQLRQEDFAEKVKYILGKTGLKPCLLELEITENVLIESFDVVDSLLELKQIGVKISLDDFGTGFSSLNYLTKLPLNTLKIDKTFVDYIKTGSREITITESIISLVHKLELEVIAEGVETQEQMDYLTQSNCDIVQGFLLCKPLIESDLINFIENRE